MGFNSNLYFVAVVAMWVAKYFMTSFLRPNCIGYFQLQNHVLFSYNSSQKVGVVLCVEEVKDGTIRKK